MGAPNGVAKNSQWRGLESVADAGVGARGRVGATPPAGVQGQSLLWGSVAKPPPQKLTT